MSWSLIGLNLGITLLFGLCLLRLACKTNTGVTIMNSDQNNGDYESLKSQIKQWEEDLDKLRGRICYATKLNRDERTENETMLHV